MTILLDLDKSKKFQQHLKHDTNTFISNENSILMILVNQSGIERSPNNGVIEISDPKKISNMKMRRINPKPNICYTI